MEIRPPEVPEEVETNDVEHVADSPSGPSKDAVRMAKKRAALKAVEALGMPSAKAAEWLIDFDNFMPDVDGLTGGDDLADQFENAFAELKNLRTGIIFGKSAATDQDAAANVDGYYRNSKPMQEMAGSEADLMFGMLVAERTAAAYALKAEQFSSIRSLMQADLVRRRSSVEVWKHNLPKAMLAFFAVMDRAGFSSKELRVRSGLFGRFLDFVVQECGGRVDRAALMEAAMKSEEHFTGYGSDDLGRELRAERERQSSDQSGEPSVGAKAAAPSPEIDSGVSTAGQSSVSCETVPDVEIAAADEPVVESAIPAGVRSEVDAAKRVRSSGFARVADESAFDAYRYSEVGAPFQFMPLRDAGPEKDLGTGKLSAADFVRLEVPPMGYEVEVVGQRSAILGRTNELMLPPFMQAFNYAEQLGWSVSEGRSLMRFGRLADPDRVGTGGDIAKLQRVLRDTAKVQIQTLVNAEGSHTLADPKASQEGEEDLHRWWLFVVYARRHPDKILPGLPSGFFHGVHGPDVSIEDGRPVLGDTHIRIIDPVQERLELMLSDEEIEAKHGPRSVRRRLFAKV